MKQFLQENFFWIVVPFVLVFGGVLLLLWQGGAQDGSQPFVYNAF